MVDVFARNNYSDLDVDVAKAKAAEFRRNPYTTGSANLDNMIALSKAVILCPPHKKKFSPEKAKYRLHPDPRMRRVNGQCDWCKSFELSWLFLNEVQAEDEQRKVEKFNRAREYGHITNT